MKKVLTHVMSFIVAIFMVGQIAVSQEIVTTAPTINTCPGTQNVQVPITVQNLAGVNSISLTLGFNSAQISYVSYTANPILGGEGTMLLVNCPAPYNKVKVAYFGLTPISLPNDAVLFTITFNVSGSSWLNWDTYTPGACQYSDFDALPIPSAFINGAINALTPDANFTSTPQICEGETASVTIDFTGGTAPFIFQYHDGVNPAITDTSYTNQFVLDQTLTSTTTWYLTSIVDVTGCTNAQVNRSTTTYVAPLANLFNVSGGGYRCENGEALSITLDGSQSGLIYQPYLNGLPTGYWSYGTGDPLTFYGFTAGGIYTIVAQNDCGNRVMSGTATIVVMPLPEVTFAPLSPVCYLTEPFQLTGGSPAGGVYSGYGVDNGYFHTDYYGPGEYNISYSYTDFNGCVNSANQTLYVLGLPSVYFAPLDPICGNTDSVNLIGEPFGGIFSGPGVVNSTFYPTLAGNGVHLLTYTVTNIDGCSNSMSQEVAVLPLPELTIDPINNVCANGSVIILNGTPAGGWFTGPGVYGNEFYPNQTGPGTFTISYNFTNEAGCSNVVTTQVIVMPVPQVNIEAIGPFCMGAPAVTLAGTPAGGIFSGEGVQNGQFFPDYAGPGLWPITYYYTDENGCSSSNGTSVTVYSLPEVFLNLLYPVCVNGNPSALYGWPLGGTYSGTGVVGNLFYPNIAGIGTFPVTYTYTDEQGCTNSAIQEITVFETPQAEFQLQENICVNGNAIELFPFPDGGWFEGPGIYGYWFYPADAGIGTHQITYHYSDNNACNSEVTHSINVLPNPQIIIEPVAPLCVDANAVELAASPVGGTFSGSGVLNGMFNPSEVGPGTWPVSYTYTDLNGCTSTESIYITVNYLPQPYIYPVYPVCVNASAFELTGIPSGGVFTGTGVENNIFNPAVAGIGTFIVTYTVTNEFGCTAYTTESITVNASASAEFTIPETICVNASAFELIGTPAGGWFEGNGVYGNWFYPAEAGTGTTTITYHYEDNNCNVSVSHDIIVFPAAVIDFPAIGPFCYINEPVTLNATPAGGEFSGQGVINGEFNPSLAGPGYWEITYTVSFETGCTSTASIYVTVNDIPEVALYGPENLCANSEAVQLIGYPEGGVFYGSGLDGNIFDPATVEPGTYMLTYIYTSENGCSNYATINITVNAIPEVTINPAGPVCVNAEPVELTGNPSGGYFSGTEVWNNYFYPAWAGVGTYAISYTYTNSEGCTNFTNASITVNPTAILDFPPLADVCVTAGPVVLIASPAGGIFSGNGVTGSIFNPSEAGLGVSEILYTYLNEYGCTSSITQTITVNNTAQVYFNPLADVCVNGGLVELSAYPEGGTFTGTGVDGNIFNPAIAGPGTYTITYNYANNEQCQGSASQTITVLSLTEISFELPASTCINNGAIALSAYPVGGGFSGEGVYANEFYPESVGAGTWPVTYTFTNEGGCTSILTHYITVNPTTALSIDAVAPVCFYTTAIALSGSPAGGVFSGEGVSENNFYPELAGIGSSLITYTFTNEFGCVSSASTYIEVVPAPEVGVYSVNPVCTNTEAFMLYGYPEGGTFTGIGVENNIFNPSIAGAGEWTVTYSYTDVYGCSGEASTVIIVNQSAIVTIGSIGPFCQSNGAISLFGTPEGGSFYGSGVFGNAFYPGEVAPGTYTIYYSWDPNGCGGIASTEVVVNPVPLVSFTGSTSLCAGSSASLSINISDNSEGPWTLEFGDGSSIVVTDMAYTFDVTPSVTTTYVMHSITNAFGCSSVVDIPVVITVEAYPITYVVSGGGIVCHEITTVDINLSGSQPGYVYTLYFNGESTNYSITGDGTALVFTVSPVSGIYSIHTSSDLGCNQEMQGSTTVTYNPELISSAGMDVTIMSGTSTTLNGLAIGGTEPYTYFWYPGSSLDDPNIANPVATPSSTTTYSLMVMDEAGCMAMDDITVTVIEIQDDIHGALTYMNDPMTPMNNCIVTLSQGGGIVATTVTDDNGYYSFMNLPFGTYSLSAQTTKPWGGGNAIDGLLMLKHFVGQQILTGLKLEAGEITGEGVINAHDALNAMRRFVGLLADYSPIGDWVFENPTLTIDGITPQFINFQGLCMSDVNGDYLPPFAKREPTITLNNEGNVSGVNGIISLPVISQQSLSIGALSLVFELPEGVEVIGVTAKEANNNLLFNQIGNELRIAWCGLEPLHINTGENLLTISIRNFNIKANSSLILDGSSSIADDNAIVIKNTVFNVPSFSGLSSELSVNNFPNPFNQTTQINYTLPENGKVTLSVYNLMGEKVTELINNEQFMGNYQITFDGSSLSAGAYIYKLELSNASRVLQQSGMMNISK